MKSFFSRFNEWLFGSKEMSGIGTAGTMSLLRGKATKFLNFAGRTLSYTSARSYGFFLLSFGILNLLLNLGEYYFLAKPQVAFSSLVVSLVIAVMSIPLLIFDRPICVLVQDFRLTDKLFFDFLSIKRMPRNVEHVTIPPLVALFLGCIPAVVAFFVGIEWVLLTLIVAFVVINAFVSPEFSMILTLLCLPYVQILPHPVWILCSLSVITFLSFLLKVVVGKRGFHFTVYDVLICLIALFVLIGGSVGYGEDSLKNSLIFISLLLGYFPMSNIIINRRLADCAINSVIVSAVPITAIALVEFIVELPGTPYVPPQYSTPGTSALYSSTSALAAFMLVSAILTLVFAIEKKHMAKKIFYSVIFVLELAVLGIIMQPEAWLAVFLSFLAYPIIKSKKIPIDALLLVIALPYLLLFIKPDAFDALFNYLGITPSFSQKIAGYGEGLRLFFENLWFGVGIGDSSYIAATGGRVPVSLNTYLGIGVELGVFVLAFLLIMVIIRLRHLSYYRVYLRYSLVSVIGEMTALGMTALLVFGAFSNVFSDIAITYMFWAVFAICTSALRTAKKEHDDRFGYYGDSSSSESGALDVGVNE